jgi:transcriptional antiterminator RfaH
MAYWVAQTENQRETIAAFFLAQGGFQTYLPRIRVNRARRSRITALFPGYIFIVARDRWYGVESTIGITNLVKSGSLPAQLADGIIDQIRARECDGLIKLPSAPKRFKRGDQVAIARGSFRGHLALYDGQCARDRVFVLFELLGRQTRVELAFGDVAPAAIAGADSATVAVSSGSSRR